MERDVRICHKFLTAVVSRAVLFGTQRLVKYLDQIVGSSLAVSIIYFETDMRNKRILTHGK